MSNITPQMVKDLREKTGAGMGDCKKALVEANGDIKEAIDILRKKGAASAAKRADRAANEGLIVVKSTQDGKTAALVEINCETDFVARNEEFIAYADKVAEALLNSNADSADELMKLSIGSDTVEGLHNEILAKFSEKIEIARFEKISTKGYITDYIHAGSKLAVLVEISADNPPQQAIALVRDIAMQIAAMNPLFITRDVVSKEQVDKEIEIYKEAALAEGKKPEIAEKIATGKLEKYFQESCLVEQAFVKDSTKVIKDVVKEISDIVGSEVNILSFKRYFLGENTED